METLVRLSSNSDAIDVYFKEQIAVMKIKKNIFDEITDLNKNQQFFHFFDLVKRDRKLKILYKCFCLRQSDGLLFLFRKQAAYQCQEWPDHSHLKAVRLKH